uniref:Peptidase M3A/M3B catalytic domain-containing protein n=1 Tax=Globodera rostochiensis TaxID=31243 RepID=A0A914HWD0_GLORO
MAMGGIRFKSLGYIPSTLSEIARTRSFLNRSIIKTAGIGIQHKRCLSNTQKLEAIRWVMQNPKPSNPTGYFITLPNVPDESAENNAFLASLEHNAKWPPLQSATPDEFYEGTVKLILEYGASVWELLDLLDEDAKKAANGDPGVPKRTFDNTAYSLLDEEYDVFYALNTLLVKMVTDWPECHPALFNEDLAQVQNTFKRELTERWTEPTWVEAVKQAYENDAGKLKPWQQRYLEWMILQARRCGYLTMKEKDKKTEIQQEINYSWNSTINLFCVRFLGCLVQDSGVNIPIEHRYLLKNAPPRALALLSKGNDPEKGPWEVSSTKHDSVFAALNYCSAREIRQQLWDSYVSRASFKSQRIDLNNSQHIEELRHNTEGFAKALGFSSTAHHRISSKMAGSPQTVRVFVDELLQRFRPVFLDRLEGAWKMYAEEQEERVISDLQAFDLFYICRREAEHCFNVDTLALMKHFPVVPTFERMLQMSSELFNIEFTDITGDEHFGFERCDPSVRIFDVTDKAKNDRVGFLYVDIFSRPSKRLGRGHWVSLHGRPANQFRSLDTLVYVLGGHPQVGPGSLLHHDELSEMLSAFGRALQLLFSQSPCHFLALPMAPYFASDFDANDFMPAFMQFCMYKPRTLELLSSPNVETGKPLGNEQATNCAKALQRSIFWDSYRVLFWTDFDLTIHNMPDWRKKFWLDLYKQMYSEYFPTFKEHNYQPCSFISVFGYPSWSGLFYRKLWAEMLALDVHRTFETENNTAATADRFKSEWLNQGATELQSDLFRRFQGREPNMQGICDFYDPKTASEDGRTEQEHPNN